MVDKPLERMSGQSAEQEIRIDPPERPQEGPREEPPEREPIRAILALSLVGIFAAEVLFGIVYLAFGCGATADRINALKDLALIFLGPTVALVGAATGFYFGRSSQS